MSAPVTPPRDFSSPSYSPTHALAHSLSEAPPHNNGVALSPPPSASATAPASLRFPSAPPQTPLTPVQNSAESFPDMLTPASMSTAHSAGAFCSDEDDESDRTCPCAGEGCRNGGVSLLCSSCDAYTPTSPSHATYMGHEPWSSPVGSGTQAVGSGWNTHGQETPSARPAAPAHEASTSLQVEDAGVAEHDGSEAGTTAALQDPSPTLEASPVLDDAMGSMELIAGPSWANDPVVSPIGTSLGPDMYGSMHTSLSDPFLDATDGTAAPVLHQGQVPALPNWNPWWNEAMAGMLTEATVSQTIEDVAMQLQHLQDGMELGLDAEEIGLEGGWFLHGGHGNCRFCAFSLSFCVSLPR